MADKQSSSKKPGKLPTIRSPLGVAAFAWIANPDSGKKYSDDKYKVTLVLDKGNDEVEAFVKTINDAHAVARGKKKTDFPVKDGDEKEKEEFKGKWLLTFKSKYQPECVDSVRNPETGKFTALTGDWMPKSGDRIKVGFAMLPYEEGKNAGISLQLRAVQVIEKRARSGGYGDAFEEEEGGYVARHDPRYAPRGARYGAKPAAKPDEKDEDDGDGNPDFE